VLGVAYNVGAMYRLFKENNVAVSNYKLLNVNIFILLSVH
jgi:hypothetical protein